jgi:spermidine/putrescine-binding protein
MKVLLSYPECDTEKGFEYLWHDILYFKKSTFYPMATAYLAASLEKAGHSVEVMVNIPNREFIKQFVTKVREFKPNAIGLTCLSSNRLSIFRILSYISQLGSKKPVVILGGIIYF